MECGIACRWRMATAGACSVRARRAYCGLGQMSCGKFMRNTTSPTTGLLIAGLKFPYRSTMCSTKSHCNQVKTGFGKDMAIYLNPCQNDASTVLVQGHDSTHKHHQSWRVGDADGMFTGEGAW